MCDRYPALSLSSDIVADMSEILQWIGALVLAKFAFNLACSLASSFYAFYVHAANGLWLLEPLMGLARLMLLL